MRQAVAAAVLVVLSGCSDFQQCPAVARDDLSALPEQLSQTGLFDAGAVPYSPAFELWSDGAEKRRWIALPPSAVIDVSDPDDWRFPTGTRLWKEFTREGVRVETRLLLKTGEADDAWQAAAYRWEGDDAVLTVEGQPDANGTAHDVPAADRCFGCHGGRNSRVLGFSAVQLGNSPGPLTLEGAADAGMLSAHLASSSFAVPGNAPERAALGLLHANCSHCHNARRPAASGSRCFDPQNELDFALVESRLASVETTGTYRTVVGKQVKPKDPEGSKLFQLYSTRAGADAFGPKQMPPLATEIVDATGVETLRAWIDGLN